jgi:hypothetical protein
VLVAARLAAAALPFFAWALDSCAGCVFEEARTGLLPPLAVFAASTPLAAVRVGFAVDFERGLLTAGFAFDMEKLLQVFLGFGVAGPSCHLQSRDKVNYAPFSS